MHDTIKSAPLDRRLSIAPMLDWTDRHCRYFLRRISRHVLLYTEMITSGALLHREPGHFLDYHPDEHPLALQLGGSDPGELAQCARLADQWNYDEINLNVGCPSDRVQSGRFGACLMAEPSLVAECVAAMRETTDRPVTVKHRIGIDKHDSYDELLRFVDKIARAGCETFIVHARKAWLQGLSPRENREVPPLRYDTVYRLKQDFPHLEIVINGGIQTLDETRRHLLQVDGAMIGRAAYNDPWMLARADQQIFDDGQPPPTPQAVLLGTQEYIEQELEKGTQLHHITRHMLGLFQGMPGARAWRRHLSEHANRPEAGWQTLLDAMAHIRG